MRRVSWRRFTALVAGLSTESRFLQSWGEDRRKAGHLADVPAEDPGALRGLL